MLRCWAPKNDADSRGEPALAKAFKDLQSYSLPCVRLRLPPMERVVVMMPVVQTGTLHGRYLTRRPTTVNYPIAWLTPRETRGKYRTMIARRTAQHCCPLCCGMCARSSGSGRGCGAVTAG